MKLIELRGKLGQGNFAQIDDEDYEYLNQFKWQISSTIRSNMYAFRNILLPSGKQRSIKMHREILGLTNPIILGDHKDGNGLNNQRYNLRIVTYSQNSANRGANRKSKYKYKGVRFRRNTWYGYCSKNHKMYEKTCKTEEEAALYYNTMALKLFGEFARLNII